MFENSRLPVKIIIKLKKKKKYKDSSYFKLPNKCAARLLIYQNFSYHHALKMTVNNSTYIN